MIFILYTSKWKFQNRRKELFDCSHFIYFFSWSSICTGFDSNIFFSNLGLIKKKEKSAKPFQTRKILLKTNRFFWHWQCHIYNLSSSLWAWTTGMLCGQDSMFTSEWVLLSPSYWINTYLEKIQAKQTCLLVNYQPGNYYCLSILRSL